MGGRPPGTTVTFAVGTALEKEEAPPLVPREALPLWCAVTAGTMGLSFVSANLAPVFAFVFSAAKVVRLFRTGAVDDRGTPCNR